MDREAYEKRRKDRALTKCRWYTGMISLGGEDNPTCEKGVFYKTVMDTSQRPSRLPCTSPDADTACGEREYPTEDEVDARFREIEESIKNTGIARAACVATGEMSGVIECPVCHGALSFTIAASNGHVWGSCATDGCVRWVG